MTNFLFVDSRPYTRVNPIVEGLKAKGVEFNYDICKGVLSAKRYIEKNVKNVDVVVIDLALPFMDDNSVIYNLFGLEVIYTIGLSRNNIPIIILSSETIPVTDMKAFTDIFTSIICIDNITSDWLKEYLNL